MAVPKKRTSKSKKNIRKSSWKNTGFQQTKKSFTLAISTFNKKKLIKAR